MHRGLMMAGSGDTAAGTAHVRAALDALLREKHSLALRLVMAEVEGAWLVRRAAGSAERGGRAGR